MDDDPFDSCAKDIDDNIKKLTLNITKWCDSIKPLITSTSLKTTKKNEILLEYSSFNTDLKQIEWDIQELEEVMEQVKASPGDYNLLEGDVIKRQTRVEQMSLKLSRLRKSINSMDLKNKLETPNEETPLSRLTHDTTNLTETDNGSRLPNTGSTPWNHQQSQIIKEQDTQLDMIGESVNALKNMSHSIGEELQHQSNMLDDIGVDMNQAMGKTDQVLKRLAQVTHLDTEKRQWYAMIYLGVAIFVLLFLNIIF